MAQSSPEFLFRADDSWIAFSMTRSVGYADLFRALAEVEAWTEGGGWAGLAIAYEPNPGDPAALVAFFDGPPRTADLDPTGPIRLPDWTPEVDLRWYRDRFDRVRAALGRGDLYQANLTFPLRAEGVDPWTLFGGAALDRPPRHAAYLPFPGRTVVCLSPETFYERDGDRLRCRPMKGTAAPDAPGQSLTEDPKSRAENLMIADMVRADLGKIAVPGSVRVPRLFALDRLPTVLQMSTEIEAVSSAGLADRFRALHPCASVTGAPRVMAMARLREWETGPRGLYCGAVGFVGPGVDRFAVAIRTAVIDDDGRGVYGVGSGLVWDSDPDEEWAECRRKAEVLAGTPFSWLETFRAGHEGPHLDRLARSATAAGFPFDRAAAERALVGHRDRVRLTVDHDGRPTVTSGPLDPWPPVLRAATMRVRPTAWHRVKTTHRPLYDAALAARPDVDEVLLFDENDRALEFCRGNLLVNDEHAWTTPPPSLGLLPGIGAAGTRERTFVRTELEGRQIAFVNALRGRIPVELTD